MPGDQEIEIAAFVSLQDAAMEQGRVAAHRRGRRAGGPPGTLFGLAADELRGVDQQLDASVRDVELDRVTIAHQRQRTARPPTRV